jgi:hypothetical protein
VTTDDKTPCHLAFKDNEHRTVYLAHRDEVLTAERLGDEHVAEEKTLTGTFRSTSQVMEQA